MVDRLDDNPEKTIEFESWGDVTDPSHHQPEKFRYLVYAVNPLASTTMPQLSALIKLHELGSGKKNEKDEGDQTINLFTYPERLDQRVALSCSLIDQDHNGTWGEAGLIVGAPSENICITSPHDVGALVVSKKYLLEQAKQDSLMSADELLQQTGPSSYNEVVVIAKKDEKRVVLRGFFYRTSSDGIPLDENLYDKMSYHSRRLNLPIIPLKVPNPYSENRIIRKDDQFRVQYGGKLYNLQDTSTRRFKYEDQTGSLTFISPGEIEQVFHFLRANKVSEDEISALIRDYEAIDTARQKPVVEYDKQGSVLSIEKRSGYGKEEEKIRVSKHGAYKVNVLREQKELSKVFPDPRSYTSITRPLERYLSTSEAEQVVSEAIRSAPEDKKPLLEQWWQNVGENTKKMYSESMRDFRM